MPTIKASIGQRERRAVLSAKAFDLRIAGEPLRAIGAKLGVSHTSIANYLNAELAALAELRAENAGAFVELELARLDDALMRLTASPAYEDGEPKAINAMIRLSESRRKLLGLDAPARTDAMSNGPRITARVLDTPLFEGGAQADPPVHYRIVIPRLDDDEPPTHDAIATAETSA